MEKEILLEYLSKGEMKICFIKKDGSERVMRCTRNLERIPMEFAESEKSVVRKESNVIPVYDLDAEGWRSFDYTKLSTAEALN
jgi:hypothetical protein